MIEEHQASPRRSDEGFYLIQFALADQGCGVGPGAPLVQRRHHLSASASGELLELGDSGVGLIRAPLFRRGSIRKLFAFVPLIFLRVPDGRRCTTSEEGSPTKLAPFPCEMDRDQNGTLTARL